MIESQLRESTGLEELGVDINGFANPGESYEGRVDLQSPAPILADKFDMVLEGDGPNNLVEITNAKFNKVGIAVKKTSDKQRKEAILRITLAEINADAELLNWLLFNLGKWITLKATRRPEDVQENLPIE